MRPSLSYWRIEYGSANSGFIESRRSSFFLLQRHDGRQRVYRRRNERFANNCVAQVDRFGGGSVMMWGAISYTGRSELVLVQGNLTAVRYRDEILRPHMLPIMDRQRELLQQDNARPHTARLTVEYLERMRTLMCCHGHQDRQILTLLSIFGTNWTDVYASVTQRLRRFRNCPMHCMHEEWVRIPRARIQRLIQSMPRRCRAVIAAHGGHTRY